MRLQITDLVHTFSRFKSAQRQKFNYCELIYTIAQCNRTRKSYDKKIPTNKTSLT